MEAIELNDSGSGAIVQWNFNQTDAISYEWQVLPLGPNNTYALRSNEFPSGQYYLTTFWAPVTSLAGKDTRIASMYRATPDQVKENAQWIFTPTNDGTGTFYLSTVQNGTGWHLESDTDGVDFLIDADSGAVTNGMKWTFSSISAIDDKVWSYTPTSTTTSSTATASSTSSAGPNSASASTTPTAANASTSQSSSEEHKTSTGAIVGGVVGGVAVLLLIIGALLFYLRRKKRAVGSGGLHEAPNPDEKVVAHNELEGEATYNDRFGTMTKSPQVSEAPDYPVHRKPLVQNSWQDPVELPAGSRG